MIQEYIAGIERALAERGDTHAVEDVLQMLENGDAQLWIDEDALIVTYVDQAPRARVLHFWITAGQPEPLAGLRRRVMEWGKGRGCDRASLSGPRETLRELAAGTEWRLTLAIMEATL